MGFLNNNGLSRVWGKIKNLVATKQDKLYIHEIHVYDETGDGVGEFYVHILNNSQSSINTLLLLNSNSNKIINFYNLYLTQADDYFPIVYYQTSDGSLQYMDVYNKTTDSINYALWTLTDNVVPL